MTRRIAVLIFTFAFAWSGLAALYSQVPAPRVGCQITPNKITRGTGATFKIFADQLPPLTAYSLTLSFTPLRTLGFTDQNDDALDGFSLKPGPAFFPESITNNLVDKETGVITLAASQSISSSLTGALETLGTIEIVAESDTDTIVIFNFTQTSLTDHNGILLGTNAYAVENCFVEIGDSGSPTPIPTATLNTLSPLISPTPTPVGFISLDPTPTSTPTETPTPSPGPTSPLPTPTDTETPIFTPTPVFTETPTDTPTPTETPTETPTATDIVITTPDNQAGDAQAPTETPLPVETPTETPTIAELPTETPTDTPEPAPSPTATPLPEPPTATPAPVRLATPTAIAQTERQIDTTIQVARQSEAPPATRRPQPYRLLAVVALFGAFTLALAFWQLGRREDR